MLSALLRSGEYRQNNSLDKLSELRSKIAALTLSQEERLGAIVERAPVIVAQFARRPDAEITFNLPTRMLSTVPRRVEVGLRYIEEVVSKYILNQDRSISAIGAERSCVLDVSDGCPSGKTWMLSYGSKNRDAELIPDHVFWLTKGYTKEYAAIRNAWVRWGERQRLVLWRGSTTGDPDLNVNSITRLPRYRLCEAATVSGLRNLIDAKFTEITQTGTVDGSKNLRQRLSDHGMWASYLPYTEFVKYRFLIDIDGNANSWGLFIKLLTGSCVLKVMSNWRQWYYDRMEPWVHFVPVLEDTSNLEQQVGWCLEHDNEAKEIGARGRQFAETILFENEMKYAADAVLRASRAWEWHAATE